MSAKGSTKDTSTFTCEGNAKRHRGSACGSGHQVYSELNLHQQKRGQKGLEGKAKERLRIVPLQYKPKATENPFFPVDRRQKLIPKRDIIKCLTSSVTVFRPLSAPAYSAIFLFKQDLQMAPIGWLPLF